MNGNQLYPSPQMNSNRLPLVRVRFDKNQSRLEYMAMNAYIYGYPLVLMDTTKKVAAGTQLNQFIHERAFPTPAYNTIVRANVDTLYSFACLDLNKEPVILSVPDTHQRYYLMELLDAWTNVFVSLGARTTGTRAGAYAICGPNWNGKLPKDLIRIDSPNYTVFIGGRTQTNGSTDFAAVYAVQNQYALIPLSNWGNPDIQNQNPDEKEKSNINPVAQVTNMSAVVFFQTMVKTMAVNPPWIADPKMNRTLAVLGLSPDSRFDFQHLSPPVQQVLQNAVSQGPRLIKAAAYASYIRDNSNGWALFIKNMGFYGADYRRRAIIAMTGTGANLPKDSIYAPAFIDSGGKPLTGTHHYLLHFEKENLPPVNAFWSITVYNERGYLAENPTHRYAISPHLDELNYNTDGSLDILIGTSVPSKIAASNWLPAPEGPFNLILRMYWPKDQVLNGAWLPPAILRI